MLINQAEMKMVVDGLDLDTVRMEVEKQVGSGPETKMVGNIPYTPRVKKVLALAGGSGITPFMGMARAIRDGDEDFDLTVIYGSRSEEEIIYRRELDELCAACGKVHVAYVLSDEEKPGFEHGFITAELIKKYADAKAELHAGHNEQDNLRRA